MIKESAWIDMHLKVCNYPLTKDIAIKLINNISEDQDEDQN